GTGRIGRTPDGLAAVGTSAVTGVRRADAGVGAGEVDEDHRAAAAVVLGVGPRAGGGEADVDAQPAVEGVGRSLKADARGGVAGGGGVDAEQDGRRAAVVGGHALDVGEGAAGADGAGRDAREGPGGGAGAGIVAGVVAADAAVERREPVGCPTVGEGAAASAADRASAAVCAAAAGRAAAPGSGPGTTAAGGPSAAVPDAGGLLPTAAGAGERQGGERREPSPRSRRSRLSAFSHRHLLPSATSDPDLGQRRARGKQRSEGRAWRQKFVRAAVTFRDLGYQDCLKWNQSRPPPQVPSTSRRPRRRRSATTGAATWSGRSSTSSGWRCRRRSC